MSSIWPFALIGITSAGAYALTALGLVAIFRGSGVLNFAHGAFGMVGAYTFWEAYEHAHWPVGVAIVLGVAAGAVVGSLVYYLVIRPLRGQSELAQMSATLGTLILLEGIAVLRYGTTPQPVSPFLARGSWTIWGGQVLVESLIVFIVVIVLAVVLTQAFRRTRLGKHATALQDSSVAASVIGISPNPIGFITWALGGALASTAGILLLPTTALSPQQLTLLVNPALAVALVARLRSFYVAVLVGLALAVAQSVMVGENVNASYIQALPFFIILVTLLLGGRNLVNRGVPPKVVPKVDSGQLKLGRFVVIAGIGFVIALACGDTWSIAMIWTAIVTILGLSVVVISGYTGQLSLAPYALAGLGALLAANLAQRWNVPFLACLVLGIIAAVLCGVVVGFTGLRTRGINFAIVTLSLALVVTDSVFNIASISGGVFGITVPAPSVFGFSLDPAVYPARFACACIVCAMIAYVAVSNIRRGRSGRRFLALRGNERGAASVGIPVDRAKLQAFAVSSGLAGLAGVLVIFTTTTADFTQFTAESSITLVGFVVVGGIGFRGGAILAGVGAAGGVFATLLSGVSSINSYLTVISGLLLILTLVKSPNGSIPLIGEHLAFVRDRLPFLAKRAVDTAVPAAAANDDVEGLVTDDETAEERQRFDRAATDKAPVLVVGGVTVRFGATVAVDDVSIAVYPGEVVGIIGPNGAGKTTLVDAITGFTPIRSGSVQLLGQDVTAWRGYRRAEMGLARTFQNLELIEDLSVEENVLIATESRRWYDTLLDLVRPDRARLSPEIIERLHPFGIDSIRTAEVSSLPQGARRLVAIARAVAESPAVVCLDEPVAGLAPSEKRAVTGAIRHLARSEGTGIILIEHDLDVIADMCDAVYVLNFGSEIAYGTPEHVLRQSAVREAYLGIPESDVSDSDVTEVAT